MKLRTQLVVAFLVMAVIPLGGITGYSYYTSSKAYREAVEREGADLALDMTLRMEGVRKDLDSRIKNVGLKPFYAFAPGDAQLADGNVEQVYKEFFANLGEFAPYLESIEFKPGTEGQQQVEPEAVGAVVTRPAPPVPPSIPVAPMPPQFKEDMDEAIVIVLSAVEHLQEASEVTGQSANEEAEKGKSAITLKTGDGNAFVIEVDGSGLLPVTYEAQSDQKKELPTKKALRRKREIHIRHQMERAQRKAEPVAKLLDEKELQKLEETIAAQVKLTEFASQEKLAGAIENEKARIECLDFAAPVQVSGRKIGEMMAQVNAKEVLGSVLERTQKGEGEIPFAIDREGRIYTMSPDHLEMLEELELTREGILERKSVPDDWLLVAKEDVDSGITFGIARPLGQGLREIRNASVQNFGYGMGMVGLALLGILPLSRRMTRNLAVLTRGAEDLAKGDLDTRVPVRSTDEFGNLARSFNLMARDLKRHQARVVEQERLQKELEMCRQIQQEMLPRNPLRLPFAEIQGISIPAREVGGDFFNYFALPGGRVAILIGDVSGKGVPAALLMANVQATLRAKLLSDSDLSELARELDVEIEESTPSNSFLTLFIGILDGTAKTLRWVNAGHNTQYILRNEGSLDRLDSTGRPLGLLPGSEFEEKKVTLSEGDSIFMYTDGLVEAEDQLGCEFGYERLEDILITERKNASPKVLARIEKAVSEFRGAGETHDDATMLMVRMPTQLM